MTRLALLLPCVIAVLTGRPASAQTVTPHDHTPAKSSAGQTLCLMCPPGRESAGTSWQTDSTPDHGHAIPLGSWRARVHAAVSAFQIDERGPRGGSGLFGGNHLMFAAARDAGGGVFGVQTMWSLEPAMGRRGYPLLTQTGETADGVTPLIDRQHPHDFPMELAATYARALADDRGVFVYAAIVGAPALGPPPFMHRASGDALPIAPTTHHWFDSTHVTFGVVTAGFISSARVKFEASVFKGREPDERRWGLETPAFDSFAGRLSINPTPSLAIQVSAGSLNDAEKLHPGADIGRLTATALYGREWRRVRLDAMAGWARNARTASAIAVPDGAIVVPGAVTRAALGEATLRVVSRHAFVTRIEYAEKDDLFGLLDPRHGKPVPITRASAGYVLDVLRGDRLTLGVGAAISWVRVAPGLRAEYGGSQTPRLLFLNLKVH